MESQLRTQFAQVQKAGPWLDFFLENFALPREKSLWLRDIGALYLNQKRWRPGDQDLLHPPDVVRAHPFPKRFPLERMQNSYFETTTDWALIWKPSGLPSHSTLDNTIENAKTWLEKTLDCPLWSLSRLDVGTRGWLLFAKNVEFAKYFHQQLEARRVRKFYEALSENPGQGLGLWQHWMRKTERAPRIVSTDKEQENDLLCQMEILAQENLSETIVWSRIELLTGRTHQIRTQFGYEGAPLLADQKYGSTVKMGGPEAAEVEQFALSCESFEFEWAEKNYSFSRPSSIAPLQELKGEFHLATRI